MTAPTPEAVAREIVDQIDGLEIEGGRASSIRARAWLKDEIAAALRAARAAAIEEAARVAGRRAAEARQDAATCFREERDEQEYRADEAAEIEAAIRALGEESAAPREEAPKTGYDKCSECGEPRGSHEAYDHSFVEPRAEPLGPATS